MAIQSERSFSGAKFNNMSRNNWKPLFEVNFSKNSTKTIRLFALDFYLNNRVFLSRNYRLIVAPRKFDVLKTNICPRRDLFKNAYHSTLDLHLRDSTAMCKMSLAFCIIIEPNSQKTFSLLFSIPTWLPWRQLQAKDIENRHTFILNDRGSND